MLLSCMPLSRAGVGKDSTEPPSPFATQSGLVGNIKLEADTLSVLLRSLVESPLSRRFSFVALMCA